jgi:hypothetical protein
MSIYLIKKEINFFKLLSEVCNFLHCIPKLVLCFGFAPIIKLINFGKKFNLNKSCFIYIFSINKLLFNLRLKVYKDKKRWKKYSPLIKASVSIQGLF